MYCLALYGIAMAREDDIAFLAGQLLPRFIPKNAAATTLSFQFTIAPSTTYRVNFEKNGTDKKGDWKLLSYEEVAD